MSCHEESLRESAYAPDDKAKPRRVLSPSMSNTFRRFATSPSRYLRSGVLVDANLHIWPACSARPHLRCRDQCGRDAARGRANPRVHRLPILDNVVTESGKPDIIIDDGLALGE
jgi:hypothetical protein